MEQFRHRVKLSGLGEHERPRVAQLSHFEHQPRRQHANQNQSTRDTAMADNLLWLANEWYQGKKLIVWAASFHTMREPQGIDTNSDSFDYHGTVSMGQAFHAKGGQDLYSIAFTSYEGTQGILWRSFDVPPSEPGSLDWLCHDAGHPYLFIDFRALPNEHWLRAPVVARALGYSYMRANWPRHFDAMIYIERMFPSTSEGQPAK